MNIYLIGHPPQNESKCLICRKANKCHDIEGEIFTRSELFNYDRPTELPSGYHHQHDNHCESKHYAGHAVFPVYKQHYDSNRQRKSQQCKYYPEIINITHEAAIVCIKYPIPETLISSCGKLIYKYIWEFLYLINQGHFPGIVCNTGFVSGISAFSDYCLLRIPGSLFNSIQRQFRSFFKYSVIICIIVTIYQFVIILHRIGGHTGGFFIFSLYPGH